METDRRRTDRHGLHGQMPRARLDGRPRRFGDTPAIRRVALCEVEESLARRRPTSSASRPRPRTGGADRQPASRRRLDHHAQRLACADGDRRAGGGQARMVRKADGASLGGRRAHGRGGARERQGRHPRLQLHPEPGSPLYRQTARRAGDRLGHAFPDRDGRGLHGRPRGAVLLAQRKERRLWRARRFRRPSDEPDLDAVRTARRGVRRDAQALCRPARRRAAAGRSRISTSPTALLRMRGGVSGAIQVSRCAWGRKGRLQLADFRRARARSSSTRSGSTRSASTSPTAAPRTRASPRC